LSVDEFGLKVNYFVIWFIFSFTSYNSIIFT
jgi:hypothetical protein